MAYRSPLGSNFKLEKSLSLSREEKSIDSPKNYEFMPRENQSGSRTSFGKDNRNKYEIVGNRSAQYNNSPNRHKNNWKSPNPRNSPGNFSVPISHYYHPSMLEDPWEELEHNSKQ